MVEAATGSGTRQPDGALARALTALARGEMVVVMDDANRENEADLVMAASAATESRVAFMVAHTTGILCCPMRGDRLDALELPLMVEDNTDSHQTAFTVSVDHVETSTGVSAADRARTIRSLGDPSTRGEQLRRPGHVFPLRYREGGVLRRAGHTEATIDLLRMAGMPETGLISELVDPSGAMMRGGSARAFAQRHGLELVTVADIVHYRRQVLGEALVEVAGESMLPTEFGVFRAYAFRSTETAIEHLVLVRGDPSTATEPVLARLHSECATGDIMCSLRCDCGSQLRDALRMIDAEGVGVLVYMRGHEGRGIGLGRKLQAYALQDTGLDTVDANLALGLPIDSRDYGVGAAILTHLGVGAVDLITNNLAKCAGLSEHGITVANRVALPTKATEHNLSYLRTKRDRLGHSIAC
ncbi:bifunctional 3,4-dihydroxy-2-butanone-4-phosphate synthase/GTP cyclohydrolase II [Nocardia mikamii]|uniref:bifunctional 3,4-dihydroxy-2-butanone-4-phosphate synthase/GTP cyclohydrolase II n=1 Tax=Nocardia mikamii TaxID=508464 RepID=UPI0007A474E9|nr:bifunctional 3,4-dihydroxy-2-butanone-4-phosphate synthase/GTP cyclohydrolase II [Nocardia mikamii]